MRDETTRSAVYLFRLQLNASNVISYYAFWIGIAILNVLYELINKVIEVCNVSSFTH